MRIASKQCLAPPAAPLRGRPFDWISVSIQYVLITTFNQQLQYVLITTFNQQLQHELIKTPAGQLQYT